MASGLRYWGSKPGPTPGGSVERPDEIQTRPAGRRAEGEVFDFSPGMAPSSGVLVPPRLP